MRTGVEDAVVIGTPPVHIALRSTRPDDYGHLASAEFSTGGQLALEGLLDGLVLFPQPILDGLVDLERTMKGQVEIESLSHELKVVLKGGGSGGVEVIVDVHEQFHADLTYRFWIDQSYLPPIIRDFRKTFLAH